MKEKAVIDRFEEGLAVILIGDGLRRINLPVERLPEGTEPGMWVELETVEGEVISVSILEGETIEAQKRIAKKLANLRN